jgi:cytochrome oxidase Cu insertion factor (SCO1/SenC/PrrC family)
MDTTARRARPAWARATATAAVLLAAVALAACGSPGASTASVSQVSGSSQTNAHYPGAVVVPTAAAKPDVTLTDTAGKPYNLAQATAGRVTLLYFGYTHCPDVCPINMALAGATLARMAPADRAKVTVAFITTDPKRDTPRVIRAWLDNFSGGSAFVGLTGTIARIHQAEKQVGMPLSFVESDPTPGPTGYEIEHAGYLLAYSQDNRAHLEFYDNEPAPSFATSLDHLVAHGFQG